MNNQTTTTTKTELMYNNSTSDGACGMNFEQFVRYYLTGVSEGMHPGNVTDVVINGQTLECTSGAGPLCTANMTEKEARAAIEGFKMKRARYIAYVPTWKHTTIEECMQHLDDVRVYSQKTFLDIMKKHGKLRAKKASNGFYCVAIQNYIPTPKFRASKKVYASILHDLATKGESLQEYRMRMVKK